MNENNIEQDPIVHKKIRVIGEVQGVFYRAHAQKMAKRLGIFGYVKNESDGSVLIEVEGKQTLIREFMDWCHEGSSHSTVDKLLVEDGEMKGFKEFVVAW